MPKRLPELLTRHNMQFFSGDSIALLDPNLILTVQSDAKLGNLSISRDFDSELESHQDLFLTPKRLIQGRTSKDTASSRFGTHWTGIMFLRRKRPAEQSSSEGPETLPAVPSDADAQDKSKISNPLLLDQELSDLYRAEAESMFRYASLLTPNASLAQDAVQEAFLKYYVQRQQGQQKADREWLFRALRHYIVDSQKSIDVRLSVGLGAASACTDATCSPQRMVEYSEAMQRLFNILSPRELECIQLRAEGFSYKEIAAVLGIVSGTVGTLLARSSEKIRKEFGEEGPECEAR
jgi:RNA polymerase sigma-70 factor (ECF subfamily)